MLVQWPSSVVSLLSVLSLASGETAPPTAARSPAAARSSPRLLRLLCCFCRVFHDSSAPLLSPVRSVSVDLRHGVAVAAAPPRQQLPCAAASGVRPSAEGWRPASPASPPPPVPRVPKSRKVVDLRQKTVATEANKPPVSRRGALCPVI